MVNWRLAETVPLLAADEIAFENDFFHRLGLYTSEFFFKRMKNIIKIVHKVKKKKNLLEVGKWR